MRTMFVVLAHVYGLGINSPSLVTILGPGGGRSVSGVHVEGLQYRLVTSLLNRLFSEALFIANGLVIDPNHARDSARKHHR